MDEVVCSIQQQHSKLYTVDTIYFSDLFYISMHWTNQNPLKELHPLLVSYGQRVDSASFCQAYFGFFFLWKVCIMLGSLLQVSAVIRVVMKFVCHDSIMEISQEMHVTM